MLVQCEHCNSFFQHQTQLVKHLTEQHTEISSSNTKCWVCNTVLPTEQALHLHMQQVHLARKTFKCKEPGCGYGTNFIESLEYHKRLHATNSFENCKVPGCNFVGSTLNSLQKHMRTKHSEKIFKCTEKECGFESRIKEEYNIHIHEKHREKLLKCQEGCDKVFVHLSNLKAHLRFHRRANFPCCSPGCNQTSKTLSHAKAHAKTHTQRSKIPCRFCGNGFVTKEGLKAHIKKFHKDKILKCPVKGCNSHAIDQNDLAIHCSRKHNTMLANLVDPIVSSIVCRVPQVTNQDPTTSAIQEPSSAIHTLPSPYPAQQNGMQNQRNTAAPYQDPTTSAGLSSSSKYKNG